MTWLDVGNGWRNLFLLSCVLQAAALGALFGAHRWFSKKSRVACVLTGVAATPFVQYLWMLLLGLVWPQAPRLVFIGAPPALAALCLLLMLFRRARRIPALLLRGWRFARRVCRFDKPALIALCFALCIVILLAPVCVRLCSSMRCVGGGDAGEYMALAQRFCNDRSLAELLEKNDLTGQFRGHSHFPSLELYMSYGLFHTGGAVGYPNDKPAFTGLGLLIFYAAAAYLALLLICCRERKAWVLLGVVLLNLVPNLYDSVATAPRDIWRILALFLSMLVFEGLEPLGNWKQYVGRLALSLLVCFTVMSAHVVCFVVLPFIVMAWVLWRWLESLLLRNRRAGRTLLGAIGIALAGAVGTVIAFLGNLWCFTTWGELSPWRLMTTYTSAPWYNAYMQIEYKLEATTTHVSFWQAHSDVLMGYATPIGVYGLRIALIAIACVLAVLLWRRLSLGRKERELRAALPKDGPIAVFFSDNNPSMRGALSPLLYCALLTLCTLAPMTGVLDSKLYSFSGAFLQLQRYTLQWFMLAAVMICAGLAAMQSAWPSLCGWLSAHGGRLVERLRASDRSGALRMLCRRLPAYLCAALCVLGTVKGLNQTGYTNTFYRYSRDVMESESILLDNGFRSQYEQLRRVSEHVAQDQRILLTRVGYQYAIDGRGYVLTSNPIVPLMNLPLEEVGAALREMNVAVLATEADFWDERYYALSTLDTYLRTLPADQVVEQGGMRLYLLDRSLIPYAAAKPAAAS
ncbi:MAG: hypothetical protein RSC91_02575 [Clostridia bacterium]